MEVCKEELCESNEIHEDLLKIVDETLPEETELYDLAELFKVFGDSTRIRILFVLFALISVAGFSQITGWNAKVGMNFSNYTGDLDMNAKVGFKLGGGFEYAFDDTWSLQPSLFLTGKGAKKDALTVNAYYLELPIMGAARFNVADNTNLVVNAGPYFACGIAGKTKIAGESVKTFSDDGVDFKRFDAGLGVGVALEFGRIIAGLDGQFGLVDVQKLGNPKNMNFSIVVGYKF